MKRSTGISLSNEWNDNFSFLRMQAEWLLRKKSDPTTSVKCNLTETLYPIFPLHSLIFPHFNIFPIWFS